MVRIERLRLLLGLQGSQPRRAFVMPTIFQTHTLFVEERPEVLHKKA